MGRVYADDEILEFAIAREVEAYNFYMALAERVKNQHISSFFKGMLNEMSEMIS